MLWNDRNMIAHIISINTVFCEQLPVRFEASRPTWFLQLFSSLHFWTIGNAWDTPCTSMGQTAPNGRMVPEQRNVGWATGTPRARGQASIAVVKRRISNLWQCILLLTHSPHLTGHKVFGASVKLSLLATKIILLNKCIVWDTHFSVACLKQITVVTYGFKSLYFY